MNGSGLAYKEEERGDKIMKVEIWSGKKAPEKVLRLRLIQITGGNITLAAVDEYGYTLSGGNILTIGYDGKLYLSGNVSHDTGIVLDPDGSVKVHKY